MGQHLDQNRVLSSADLWALFKPRAHDSAPARPARDPFSDPSPSVVTTINLSLLFSVTFSLISISRKGDQAQLVSAARDLACTLKIPVTKDVKYSTRLYLITGDLIQDFCQLDRI